MFTRYYTYYAICRCWRARWHERWLFPPSSSRSPPPSFRRDRRYYTCEEKSAAMLTLLLYYYYVVEMRGTCFAAQKDIDIRQRWHMAIYRRYYDIRRHAIFILLAAHDTPLCPSSTFTFLPPSPFLSPFFIFHYIMPCRHHILLLCHWFWEEEDKMMMLPALLSRHVVIAMMMRKLPSAITIYDVLLMPHMLPPCHYKAIYWWLRDMRVMSVVFRCHYAMDGVVCALFWYYAIIFDIIYYRRALFFEREEHTAICVCARTYFHALVTYAIITLLYTYWWLFIRCFFATLRALIRCLSATTLLLLYAYRSI